MRGAGLDDRPFGWPVAAEPVAKGTGVLAGGARGGAPGGSWPGFLSKGPARERRDILLFGSFGGSSCAVQCSGGVISLQWPAGRCRPGAVCALFGNESSSGRVACARLPLLVRSFSHSFCRHARRPPALVARRLR